MVLSPDVVQPIRQPLFMPVLGCYHPSFMHPPGKALVLLLKLLQCLQVSVVAAGKVLVPLLDFVCTVRQQYVLPVRVSVLVLLEGCLQFSVVAAGRACLVRLALHRCPDFAEVGFSLAVG